ncbi:outer membrane lipoprotein carrier protein LolA [candidate division WOR-3 bacterium]|nr:outer membrane lipoprotein carrier protein LolA [candidate division WOR-3 bacterium]MCK4528657.1 outer membrane lipoprotein carrier protein LolA [candidate division WOR-3 bacterium]
MIFFLISISVLSRVEERFSKVQSLECTFVETLWVENGSFEFTGFVYIVKEASRIDVKSPDEQVVIFRGDSVSIYIKKDDRLERTIAPLSLSRLIFAPGDYYLVDSIRGGWSYLSSKDNTFFCPLAIRFDKKELFPLEIRFTQDGGEGRFYFYNYKVNPSLPGILFDIDSLR